ncbi:MAG TPA: bifunctional pyr operon transcriptional regulator/uracil phosphoribosyltransferase PyrR [Candidatus Acidoferrum sp.]|nr:bifunctional pyr operon transcriptional regulator/uracil phosphoribosyltransferase PyrR [Candidatus Acidoferrum sp.]
MVKANIMDEGALRRAVTRISYEIIERNKGAAKLCLLGIPRRGVLVAARIADKLHELEGLRPPCGLLDPAPFRDDLAGREIPPDRTELPCSLDGMRVVLIDDVIHTGRTVRAAIDAIMAKGRPELIQLAVLVDRGHRELPIKPDYVGKNLPTSRDERVAVTLTELDGEDGVSIVGGAE